MKNDSVFYYALITIIIAAIASSIMTVLLLEPTQSSFSSISFDEPDNLPTKAKVGTTHTVDYTVESQEEQTALYTLTSTLTLYELYDPTEGLYSCLKPYRTRVYANWYNSSNTTHLIAEDTNENIPDLRIAPAYFQLVPWETHHLELTLGRIYGAGEFVLWYGNENETFYTLRFDATQNATYLNDEYIGAIQIGRQNDKLKLDYNGSELQVYYNKVNIANMTLSSGHGQFGFETRDMFISLNQIVVYKDVLVEVPDRGNVWYYELDNKEFTEALREARKGLLQTANLYRRYAEDLNVSTCGTEFACELYNVREGSYVVEGHNSTELLQSLPLSTYGSRFWLIPRGENETLLPWSYFDLSGIYFNLTRNETVVVLFEEVFGLLITKNSIATLEFLNGDVYIEQYPLEAWEASPHNISIHARDTSLTIEVDNTTITTELASSLKGTRVKAYHHNTFNAIGDMTVKKFSSLCTGEEYYSFCEIHISQFRSFLPSDQEEVLANIVSSDEQKKTILERLLLALRFSSDNESEQQLVEEIATTSAYFIPTKTYAFDGPSGLVQNKTNITFAYSYYFLDGKGVIDLVYYDLTDKPVLTVRSKPLEDMIEVHYDHQNITAYANTTLSDWNFIELTQKEDVIFIRQNSTTLIEIDGSLPNGYFSMESVNTYAEFKGARLIRNGLPLALPISDNPCDLRLVYEEVLRESSFALKPEMNQEFSDEFVLRRDFDYGLVSVELEGPESLEIHAWMVRE